MRVCQLVLLSMALLVLASKTLATPYTFSYGGRLLDGNDKAIAGPVAMELKFWNAPTGGSDILGRSVSFSNVVLSDGIFQLDAAPAQLSTTDMQRVFAGNGDKWVEVRDVTHNLTYPRQRLTAVPFAMKVPVDGKTITYDANGNLTFMAGAPSAGQVLSTDGNGSPSWIAASQGGGGTVTSVVAGTGLKITGGAAAISTTGTLTVDVGTTVGKIIQVDASNKLPAIDGSNLTNLNAAQLTGTLPIVNGANITNLNAANLVGTLPVLDGSSLVSLNMSNISGTVGMVRGGTGSTSFTSGGLVFSNGSQLTNSSNLFWNNSSSNLGVGTSNPRSPLDVNGTVSLTASLSNSPGSGFLNMYDNAQLSLHSERINTSQTFVHESYDSVWHTGFAVTSNGNVGIGTTSPQVALEVNGAMRLNTAGAKPTCDVAIRGSLFVEQGGTGVTDTVYLCLKSAANTYNWVVSTTGG